MESARPTSAGAHNELMDEMNKEAREFISDPEKVADFLAGKCGAPLGLKGVVAKTIKDSHKNTNVQEKRRRQHKKLMEKRAKKNPQTT